MLLRVDVNDGAIDMDHEQRLLYDGTPFTGEVFEGSSEDPVSLETYRDGWLHGPWRLWYLDGSPRAQGELVNGRFVGETLAWHENGRLEARKLYSVSGKKLASYAWDEDGRQTRAWTGSSTGRGGSGARTAARRIGVRMLRIDINDPDVGTDLALRLTYRGELFTGEATDAPEEPTVLETYRDGLRHGPWREWYLEGALKTEATFQEGHFVGEYQQWYEDGRLAIRRLYTDQGQMAAEYQWTPDGQLQHSWPQGCCKVRGSCRCAGQAMPRRSSGRLKGS
ncbi:toxin-antitoxin system YwqK family antitoxin [Kitasatospora sp. NPDC101801]|uniref:toxin-antitoxin system YwqK family antitoxin n=1 Tax=Kitasatospora sp. NPDC101801 TaxID=3364103 RepID=UPI00381874A5